jgi:ACS family hexuronate transporter-like MFS transporter
MSSFRWYVAAMLFLASVINYVDRQVLAVVAPILTKEFKLSPSDYAAIGLAFQIPYTLMYVGSGLLVDRWGTKRALASFMAWWSGAGVLHALASNAFSLGACRALLGLGEPGNFMAGFRAISEWFPSKERALVNGLLNAGAAAGAILAPPLVAWLALRYGWRQAFVITGLCGFIWLLAWLRVPARPPNDAAPAQSQRSWAELLRIPEMWGLFLPRLISDPVWWFYLLWLPKYLAEQRGFTMLDIGRLAWMPYLAADAGAILGGLATGWFIRRGSDPVRARAAGMLPFALLMPLSLLIPQASTGWALALICAVTFAHMAWKTNLQTVTNDIFPAATIGSVSGMIAFGSGLGGSAFTWLTGWVVQHFSYDAIFIIMGTLHPAAYLNFRWIFRRRLARTQYPNPGEPAPGK